MTHEARRQATAKSELFVAANRFRTEAISVKATLSSSKLELSNKDSMIKGLNESLRMVESFM